jgi:hypothetical protein
MTHEGLVRRISSRADPTVGRSLHREKLVIDDIPFAVLLIVSAALFAVAGTLSGVL